MGASGEYPVTFAVDGTRLAGMLHTPHGIGPLGEIALVMIPGGLTRRVGLHRLFTNAARAFAALGAWVLRFDLPGVGQSEGQVRWVTKAGLASLDARYVSEARAALDCLDVYAPPGARVLLGHCNGARSAVATAVADSSANGVIAWGMPTGAADGAPLAPWVEQALETLRERRIPALFVYGTKDPAWPHFEALVTGATPESRDVMARRWTVHSIAAANHDFTAVYWTREVIEISARWMRDQRSGSRG